MEDPVDFDVWASPRRERLSEVLPELERRRPETPRLELAREVRRALREGMVLLASRVSWTEVQRLRAAPPAWAERLEVFQAGYGPTRERLLHCAEHDLAYAGCLGCHVCRGFYVS